jgi:phage terminase small subunit
VQEVDEYGLSLDAADLPSVFPRSFAEDGLTGKQRRFCFEYLVDLNATQAVIRSGYSPIGASFKGHRLLSDPKIRAAIAAEAERTLDVPPKRIITELARIAFANMLDFIQIQEDGSCYVDLSKICREQAAAIGEIVTEEYTEGRGELAREVKRVKFKLSDKPGALEKLARIYGLFIDRKELTGKDGTPLIPPENLDKRSLARAVLSILREAQIENAQRPEPRDDPQSDDEEEALPDDLDAEYDDIDEAEEESLDPIDGADERYVGVGDRISVPIEGGPAMTLECEQPAGAEGKARWRVLDPEGQCHRRIWGQEAATKAAREVAEVLRAASPPSAPNYSDGAPRSSRRPSVIRRPYR